MKIIHLADVHLDSKLNSHLSIEKAKQRKAEILMSFGKVVDYAIENDVKVVIIAGDLFDSNKVLKSTEKYLFDKINSAKDIDFIYIKGNHDDNIEFSTEILLLLYYNLTVKSRTKLLFVEENYDT